jgi:hypothetical protein
VHSWYVKGKGPAPDSFQLQTVTLVLSRGIIQLIGHYYTQRNSKHKSQSFFVLFSFTHTESHLCPPNFRQAFVALRSRSISNDHKQTAITKIERTENTSQSHSLWFFSFTHTPTHQCPNYRPSHSNMLSHKQDTGEYRIEKQFSVPSKYSYSTYRTGTSVLYCTCQRCHLVSFFYDYRSSIMLIKSLVHYFFPATVVASGTIWDSILDAPIPGNVSSKVQGIMPKQFISILRLVPNSQYQTSTSW